MIKFYENQRAAISSNGWLTLIIDPLNWIFNVYIGGVSSIDVLASKFKEHLIESADYVDDVKMTARYESEELKEEGAVSGANWLRKRLKKCPEFVSGNRAGGITLPNDNGPIVVLVPGFKMDDPHYISVLAHELIHATFEFAYSALHVEEGGGNEFFACTHTTLFERILDIVRDSKEDLGKSDEVIYDDSTTKKPSKLLVDAAKSAAGFKHPVQDGMPLAVNQWVCNILAFQDVTDKEFPYKIYLIKSPDVGGMYQLVISDGKHEETKHYVVMCNFKRFDLFGKLDDLITDPLPTAVKRVDRLESVIKDLYGEELILAACEKYRRCFSSKEELNIIKSKYHLGDVYEFKKNTTFTDSSRDAYVSLNEDTMLMISCFNDQFVKLITSTDGEYEVSLVEFDRFVRDGVATFRVPNRNPDDNGETGKSLFDVHDIFVFTKGVHLHIAAETLYSEIELADEKTLIITRIEGEWIFLDDTKSDLGFRITSKDMFNYYQNGKILYKRKAKDEPEPAARGSSCNEEKEIEDMLAKAPEFKDDKFAVNDNFFVAKDIWGFRTIASNWKDKHLRKGLKITLVSIKECYVILQGFVNMRTRKFLGNKHEFEEYLRKGAIEKIDGPILQETGEIRTGTIFICKEELKTEDLPGLEYNLGKGVQFEITSMSPDLKWCDISAGSYEASGFDVARIEKLLHDGVIVKKTQSN